MYDDLRKEVAWIPPDYEKCGNYKLLKSNYIKNQYSNLLLSNENNKNHYKKLIEINKNNLNTKMIYVKLLIQYAELINKLIVEFSTFEDVDVDFKYDIMILHWLEYINYRDALNTLSSCKIHKNKLINYDIEYKLDVFSFKTNLSAIEFIYAKIDYYNFPKKNTNDLLTIRKIIDNYKLTYDYNLLEGIKKIENKYKKKIIEGFGNKNNSLLYIILAILLFFLIQTE